MHIFILYTPALKQGGGIGRYTRGLVDALLALEGSGAFRFTLVVTRDAPMDDMPALPPNARLRVLPFTERQLTIAWHRLRLPLWLDSWIGGADLVHATDFVLPPLRRAKGLLTVHDLSFLAHPQGAVPALKRYLEGVVPRSVARAAHVLADSVSTQHDLEHWLGLAPEAVTVVGAGVEGRFREVGAEPGDAERLLRVREQHKLPERFILGLGTLEPRKNFDGLISAFERVADHDEDIGLVIAGGKGWLYEPIFEAAAISRHASRIHMIGFVDDEDLPALYSLAQVFAFPSHYEGFGIPALEAMACGTPVVAANNSSLPEVIGDAGLLVPTGDEVALAAALARLLGDSELRDRLRTAGLERAKAFTWKEAAQRLLAVYEQVCGGNDSR